MDDLKAYEKQVLGSEINIITFLRKWQMTTTRVIARWLSYADAALKIKLRTQDTYTHV